MTANENNNDQRFVGLLAQFENPTSLVQACDQARQAGYKKMDAYSPFPVHGIDPAIGIKRTSLPFIVLAIGLGACAIGLALQYYTNNAVDTFGFSLAMHSRSAENLISACPPTYR